MRYNLPPNYGPIELFAAEQVFRGIDGNYAIFAYVGPFGFPIDAGESDDIGDRIRTHDRKGDWFAAVRGLLVVLRVWAAPTPLNVWNPKGYRLGVERFWRYYYRALGFVLCGQRP